MSTLEDTKTCKALKITESVENILTYQTTIIRTRAMSVMESDFRVHQSFLYVVGNGGVKRTVSFAPGVVFAPDTVEEPPSSRRPTRSSREPVIRASS